MVSIRKSNPELKIVLSVGGWGADGFSQAARTKEGRERFAASALAIVKEYGLDGIDTVSYTHLDVYKRQLPLPRRTVI